MSFFLFFISFVIFIGLVSQYFLLPYRIETTMDFPVEREKVRLALEDLCAWPTWSPWLMYDDQAITDFGKEQQGNNFFHWKGKYVGEGKIIKKKSPDQWLVEMDLFFYKPYKTIARSKFQMLEIPNGTRITWFIDSDLSILMYPLKNSLQKLLQKDCMVGLARLLKSITSGREGIDVRFEEIVTLPDSFITSYQEESTLEDLPLFFNEMKNQPSDRYKFNETSNLKIYSRTIDSNTESMIILDSLKKIEPNQSFRGGRFLKVSLLGSAKYVDLAWHVAQSYARMRKHKEDTSRYRIENYILKIEFGLESKNMTSHLLMPIY